MLEAEIDWRQQSDNWFIAEECCLDELWWTWVLTAEYSTSVFILDLPVLNIPDKCLNEVRRVVMRWSSWQWVVSDKGLLSHLQHEDYLLFTCNPPVSLPTLHSNNQLTGWWLGLALHGGGSEVQVQAGGQGRPADRAGLLLRCEFDQRLERSCCLLCFSQFPGTGLSPSSPVTTASLWWTSHWRPLLVWKVLD